MESLYIIKRESGIILIEKHWKKGIATHLITQFYNNYLKNKPLEPIYNQYQCLFLPILINEFIFLAVNEKEAPPLMVIEFLYKIIEVLKLYIGDINEFNLKENYVIIYQLLEEMIDYGFPLITDSNNLRGIITPPTMINKVISKVTGVSNTHDKLLTGSLSNIAWRKNGIVYKSNEIYFDIVEEIDAILANDGTIVSSEIHGSILANCRLSGMPDLTISFNRVDVIDDFSFHPCVRHDKFQLNKILNFIPPDGQFKLMSYRTTLNSYQFIPITITSKIHKVGEGGRFEIIMHPKFPQNKIIENILFGFKFNHQDINNIIAHPNIGTFMLDYQEQNLIWKIEKLNPKDKVPILNGTYTSPNQKELSGVGEIKFNITNLACSNLKIDSLKVINENYKPYKGVRALTKAGSFQVRI
ncbi:adaptor-related protein complex 3 mu 1 subunit-like protein [Neoconidiobolus thromboides FSU 785]|nr:adaptor-related protein complex 3 mu 1 subunit-like protein [Neoconidiobolus thromboides FSU 785]